MSTINYSEKIPNNVNLSEDRTLQRALEQWQPNFLNWWDDMGPDGSRTSTSTCAPPSASTRRAGRSSAT
jgi:benzoyl-CoA 2,3-dioxygenase component B